MFPTDQQKRLLAVNSANPSLRSVAAPFSLQGGNFSLQGVNNTAGPQLSSNMRLGPVQIARPGGLQVGDQTIQQNGGIAGAPDRTPTVNPLIAGLRSIGQSVVSPYQYSFNVGAALGSNINSRITDNQLERQQSNEDMNNLLTPGRIAGNVAQIGLMGAGGLLGKAGEAVGAPIAGKLFGGFAPKLVGTGAKLIGGSLVGAPVTGAYNVAAAAGNGDLTKQNAAKTFGQGAELGLLGGPLDVGLSAASSGLRRVFTTPSEQNQFINYLSHEKDPNAIHNTLTSVYGHTSDAIKQASADIANSPNKQFIVKRLADLPEEGAAVGVGGELVKDAIQTQTEKTLKAHEAAQQRIKQERQPKETEINFGSVDPNILPPDHVDGIRSASFTPEEQQLVDQLPHPPSKTPSVSALSKNATNSFENAKTGVKPGGIARAAGEIDNGSAQPIRYRVTPEGQTIIEDGRHRLEAARQAGIEDFPAQDVTDLYSGGKAPGTKARNMRQFEYTDTPMTEGEKQALADLEGHQVNTDYAAASNELRKLANESGQTDLYKKVMATISAHNMSQAEATNFIKQGLDQMRSSGTNAKIRMGVKEPTPSVTPEQQAIAAQAPAPQEAPAIKTAQIEAAVKASGKSTLPAVTKMADVLNTGGTVDEALNEYMQATGANIGEAKVALQKMLQQKGVDRGSINASLNPKYNEVSVAPVAKGSSDQAILNSKTIRNEVTRYGNKALQAVDNLSEHDHQLMDAIRSTPVEDLAAQAENPGAFIEAAQAVKDYNDYTHAAGSGLLGQEVPYRQNYGAPLLFDQSAEGQAALADAQKAALKNSPGYGKSRTFKDYNEAASYGAKRLHQNFSQDLAHDISRRSSDLSQLTLHQGLEDAFPGQVKVGDIGSTPEGTYSQLQIPGGQKLSLPKNLADQINRRAQPVDSQGFVKGYDTVNRGLKYVKLGGGAFHALTEAGNFVGQQLASGKLFTEPGSAAKVFKTFFSSKAMDKEMAALESKGVVHNADLAGLVRMPEGILADANVSVGGKAAKYTGIKALHDATFQREIPYAKLKTFEQQTQGLDFNNPQDVAQARAIAKEINQNYGGINRAVEGLTPKTFKSASRVVLATDFTEGKIRTLADALSKGGPEGKLARQVVLGKALLFGGLATAGGAVAGEYQGKTPQEVAKTILEKFADPKFASGGNSVALPATHVSEFTRPFESFFNGSKDKFAGIKHYATGRLAAVPSEVNQLANNLDYTGNHIYGKNTKKNGGQPFTPLQTAANVASGFSPIPVSQGIGVGSGKTGPAAAVANTVGLRVTPNQAAQTKANDTQGGFASFVGNQNATKVSKDDFLKTLSPQDRQYLRITKDGKNVDVSQGTLDAAYKAGKLSEEQYNYATTLQKTYSRLNSQGKAVTVQIGNKTVPLPDNLDPTSKAYYTLRSKLDKQVLQKFDDGKGGPANLTKLQNQVADNLNKQLPTGIKGVKPSPQLLNDYAKFQADQAQAAQDGQPWDDLTARTKLKGFWSTAIKGSQDQRVQEIYKQSSTQLKDYFIKNKKVSTDDVMKAIGLDDALFNADLIDSPHFSKTFRKAFGVGMPNAYTTGGSGGSGGGSGSGTGQYVNIDGKNYQVTAEGTPVKVTGSDGLTKIVRVNAQGLSSGSTGLSSLVPSNLSFKTPAIDTTPQKVSFKVKLPEDVRGNPRPQRVASTRYTTVRVK